MKALAVLVVATVALPGAIASVHLTVLCVASLFYRPPPDRGMAAMSRFLVLIPAHNEEAVLGPTLEAIGRERRPGDSVLVVADRCTDATADIARRHGAHVLERGPGEEPGRAAARQAGVQCALELDWDAVIMIDADSVVEPGFFVACDRVLAGGASAIQARSEAALDDGLIAQTSLAAFALHGITVPRGQDRLKLSVWLRGTGMVLRRDVVERYAFRSAASEDLCFGLALCVDGIRIRHVDDARLRSANPPSWRAASDQRLRYEAGRMSAARDYVRSLLGRRSAASLEAAVHILTPPFTISLLSLFAGVILAKLAGFGAVAFSLVALIVLLGVDLAVALVQSGARARTWLALGIAPWYLLWKVGVQVRAAVHVRRRVTAYGPTPRR